MPRGRPPYPELLTPREQEVLELIAEGLTNEQIAGRLGISFGGAKYHVAEILSKLGVNSRDEAVLYLRRPQRSRFAALAPLLFWKRDSVAKPKVLTKAAAAAGVVAVLAIGAFVLLPSLGGGAGRPARDPDPLAAISADLGFDAQGNLVQRGTASNLTSYYFEASVETGPRPQPPGGRSRSPAQQQDVYPTLIRSWFDARGGSRWDALSGNQLIYRRVAGGGTLSYYDGSSNTYVKLSSADAISSGVEVGPLPAGGVAGLFNAQDWNPAGQEVVAGRITQIVEYNVDGQLERIWVDTEYDFVLKHESNDGMNPHRVSEVTHIDYNGAVSPQQLQFDLPALAREMPAVTGPLDQIGFALGPVGPDSIHAKPPAGMLALTYAPEGLRALGASASTRLISTTESMVFSYVVDYGTQPDLPPTFVVTQQFRAGGLAPDMRTGEQVSLRGGIGYRQGVPGEERLVFQVGDIIVTLSSTVLPLDELLMIAEGMQ